MIFDEICDQCDALLGIREQQENPRYGRNLCDICAADMREVNPEAEENE